MKKLIISIKPLSLFWKESKEKMKEAFEGNITKSNSHYEISFSSHKELSKFLRNMDLVIAIREQKPESVYELAKILNKDQSNLNKIIKFFEEQGVIRIEKSIVNNRTVNKPIVDYQKIEFDLTA